jgi:murein DD-endopeptidase MepM/ murein hydrolase activator NlpD
MVPQQQPLQQALPKPPYPDRFAQLKNHRDGIRPASHRIRPGDTLYQLLVDAGVAPREVGRLLSTCKSEPDMQRLRAGELVEFFFDRSSEQIHKVRYQDKDGDVLVLGRGPGGWVSSRYRKPVVVTTALAQGTISESLYESASDEDIDFELAMALADIFAWDIDFYVDLRPDDSYRFLYEERFREGALVGHGRILVAVFDNAGVRHQAYYYRVPGREADYYDARGRSLRKVFLKSPLRYTRISSGFSRRRLHPILKIYRPHLGIDYAAPVGTPVVAVGDGRIAFKGWKGGYGRFIAIRHNGRYTTTYGHLSRYASGLKRADTVKQGQVIGYVGASGLATGPHLDFRMQRRGKFVNPLRVSLAAAEPVPPAQMEAFQQRVVFLESKLARALAEVQSPGAEQSSPLAATEHF